MVLLWHLNSPLKTSDAWVIVFLAKFWIYSEYDELEPCEDWDDFVNGAWFELCDDADDPLLENELIIDNVS